MKSLLGEDLAQVEVDGRGVLGDRLWSVRDHDGKLGSGKSTRRFRRMDGLLDLAATYDGQVPVIRFPDGRVVRGDDPDVGTALSGYVGRPVNLVREDEVSHFDEGPLHLVTTTSLSTIARSFGRPVDWRHTRANLLLDLGVDLDLDAAGLPEHGWVGRQIQVGPALVLRIRDVMPRCVMVEAAQHELPREEGLLREIGRQAEGALGAWADVVRTGRVSVGDPVTLLPPD